MILSKRWEKITQPKSLCFSKLSVRKKGKIAFSEKQTDFSAKRSLLKEDVTQEGTVVPEGGTEMQKEWVSRQANERTDK